LFVNGLTTRLGKISYSIYLFHFLALYAVLWCRHSWHPSAFGSVPDFFVAFPLVLGVACVIATLTFSLIERSGQKLGRRLIWELERRPRTDVG
jgi:peptidoglycan/LPS O-acetylase OafA/YrhL